MNEYEHAEKWVELARNENDYFDKFVYSFFAFNALYSPYFEKNERQAIRSLFDEYYNENRTFVLDMYRICETDEFYYFVDRDPIKNCRYNPKINPKDKQDTTFEHSLLMSKNRYKCNIAMLMIIYQIRCNLFHGNKQYYNPDDQEIIKNASILLVEYLESFLKCYKSLY